MKSKIHEHQKTNKRLVSKQKIRTLVIALAITLLMPAGAVCPNFISFVKSLLESGKQTTQLLKTVKFLKQQKENVDKVNNVVKQLKAVKELANNNKRLFDIVQRDLREIFNSPYIKPHEVNRVSDSFESIIENSIDGVEHIDRVLSSGLKMTDAERVEVLRAKEQESKEMVAEIEAKTRRYREIIAFREMQAVINGRKAKF